MVAIVFGCAQINRGCKETASNKKALHNFVCFFTNLCVCIYAAKSALQCEGGVISSRGKQAGAERYTTAGAYIDSHRQRLIFNRIVE